MDAHLSLRDKLVSLGVADVSHHLNKVYALIQAEPSVRALRYNPLKTQEK